MKYILQGMSLSILLVILSCNKEKIDPVSKVEEIIIDAVVPAAMYSNLKRIDLDAARTLLFNGTRQLSFNWTCTNYPAARIPRIDKPTEAHTFADSLTVGKYTFMITVMDTAGNKAASKFDVEVIQDTLQGPPKISPITDQVIHLPLNFIYLDWTENSRINPKGRVISFKWSIISQPAGSPAVSIQTVIPFKTSFGGLVEGNYLMKFDVTNDLSLTSSDTVEVKVMPDSLKGTTRIYDNLTWTFYPDDGWGNAVILIIPEPDIFTYRNENNTQISVWDEENKDWIAPGKFTWVYNYIYYTYEPIESITGKKAKVQVKFL